MALLQMVLDLYESGRDLLQRGVPVQELLRQPVLAEARRLKALAETAQQNPIDDFNLRAEKAFADLRGQYLRQQEETA